MSKLDEDQWMRDVRFLQTGNRAIHTDLELISGQMAALTERVVMEHQTAPIQAQARLTPQLTGYNAKYWDTVKEQGSKSLLEAAQMSATRAYDVDLESGMPSNGILQYMDSMDVKSAELAGQQIDQELAPRVEANKAKSLQKVLGFVGAVATISDLSDILRGVRTLARDMRDFFSPRTPRGAAFSSHRLLQDQTARGYHELNKFQGKERPWIEFFDWHLSSAHPEGDICDRLAANSPYRVDAVPELPHPYCFCFVTPAEVDPNKMQANLIDGKYDDWLRKNGVTCNG